MKLTFIIIWIKLIAACFQCSYLKKLSNSFKNYILFGLNAHATTHTWRSEVNLGRLVLAFSTLLVLEMEFRSLGWAANSSIPGTVLPALLNHFLIDKYVIKVFVNTCKSLFLIKFLKFKFFSSQFDPLNWWCCSVVEWPAYCVLDSRFETQNQWKRGGGRHTYIHNI